MRFVDGSTDTALELETVVIVVIALNVEASSTVTFGGVVCEQAKL